MTRPQIVVALLIGILTIGGIAYVLQQDTGLRSTSPIDVDRLESFMQQQLDLGYRIPGSAGSLAFKDWIVNITPSDWVVKIQNFTYDNVIQKYELRNYFITYKEAESYPRYLFGAHYDSRAKASADPNHPNDPVPGANDAASGVAAILEMMQHLEPSLASKVGFVLFDAEDQGSNGMTNFPWIIGSNYFAGNMTEEEVSVVRSFVLFDMIANDELVMTFEGYSNTTLNYQIWNKADELGYSKIFQKTEGPHLIDDHKPFLERGIPSVDLIDFYYPEWHTINDDMDHISAEKAAIVLDTTMEWLQEFDQSFPVSSTTSTNLTTTSYLKSETDTAPVFFIPAIFLVIPFVRSWSKYE